MDDFVGNGNANTINAGTVNATSGAKETTINSGDEIDGGAGTDTLNITSTADNNTSLTGLTVKNVEVINLTGTNNLATKTSTTAVDAAVAGAAEVRSVQISSAAPEGEKVSFDFGDLVVAAGEATGSEGISIAMAEGDTLSVEVADGADGAAVAKAIAAVINAADAEVEASDSFALATATVVGNTLQVAFPANAGVTAELYNPGALSLAVLNADGEVENTAFDQTKVTTSLPSASTTAGDLTTAVRVEINGTNYDLGNVTIEAAKYYGDVPAEAEAADKLKPAAEKVDVSNAIRDLVKAKVNEVLGATVTASNGDEQGELLVTGTSLGQSIPSINVFQTATKAAVSATDAEDTQAVKAVSKTLATGAVAMKQQIDFAGSAAGDTFQLMIDGASYGTTTIAAEEGDANIATSIASNLNSILGLGSAIAVGSSVTVTALEAGTPLPNITLIDSNPTVAAAEAGGEFSAAAVNYINAKATAIGLAITAAEGEAFASDDALTADEAAAINATEWTSSIVRQNAVAVGSTTTVTTTAATVSGASFVGAEQVWLKGAASNATNLTVSGAQVAGLNGVTGIDGQTYTLGTASTLAISGATTATDKTANVKGGGTSLNIIGTGTSGFSITETNATDKMDALAVDTSGATTLTVSGLTALETISQSGAGALTIKSPASTVHTVTGGAAADKLTIATATAKDNVSTAKDETVNAVLKGGAGADTIVVTVSGAGNTTVEGGEGADTIKVNHTATGEVSIGGGAGNDTIWLQTGTGELTAKSTVDGGEGSDTLALDGDTTYLTGDYTKLSKYATSIEKLMFFGATASSGASAFDASKLANVVAYTVSTGDNYFQEVAADTAFTNMPIVRLATDYLGAITNYGAENLVIVTDDFLADEKATDEIYDGNYGQDISIVSSTFNSLASKTETYTVSASDVTLTIAAIGGATTATSSAQDVTLKGQMETVTVVLSSARGSKAAVDNGDTEYMAKFSIDTDATNDNDAMQGLTSITVAGTGVVVIDTSGDANDTNDLDAAQLKLIDLSGMTDFEDLNYKGESQSGSYSNKATSTITLNSDVAEEVKLGGAKDTVDTNSSVDFMDSIVNFSLNATADETDADDVVDTATSDAIDIETAVDNTAGTDKFVKNDDSFSSLDAALLELTAKTVAGTENIVFHAEGNTYLLAGDRDGELDSGDVLVELVGTYDLDLLLNVII